MLRKTQKPDQKHFFAQMLKAAFPEVVEEYRFHPKRRWRVDYYIPSKKTAIEIEGGVFTLGRHTRAIGFLKDIEKYNALSLLGFKLYRLSHTDLKSARSVMKHIHTLKSCLW